MRTSDFDYTLPSSAIGQPSPRRDSSKMLVLERATGRTSHRVVRDLPEFLSPGDLVVVNDTKVFRARLRGMVNNKPVELLLLRPERTMWLAIGRPGHRLRVGATVVVGRLRCVVRDHRANGTIRIAFGVPAPVVIAYANRVGEVPTPPYVATQVRRLSDYQTTYARHVGSVAAPTAGFHLTPRLIRELRAGGMDVARVTLHVGIGTFRPIRTERIADHEMHAEWAEVSMATIRAIGAAKRRGGRVVAIGTTTLRALEGWAAMTSASLVSGSFSGWVNLFVTPGFRFRVVDALFTNFHLPRSSLLVLVSTFAAPGDRTLRGRDVILRAYRTALRKGYRFYSFGDAMLIR